MKWQSKRPGLELNMMFEQQSPDLLQDSLQVLIKPRCEQSGEKPNQKHNSNINTTAAPEQKY